MTFPGEVKKIMLKLKGWFLHSKKSNEKEMVPGVGD